MIIGLALIVVILAAGIYGLYTSQIQNPQKQGIITVTDSLGYQTTLDKIPQKIISIAPSVTPILYEIGVGEKVVGLTQFDDHPYNFSAWFEAGNMTCIGGFSNPNMEAIALLQPDLIFTTDINLESIPKMREFGFSVICIGPRSIEGVFETINLIGKVTGAEENAETLVTTLRNQINLIKETVDAANIEEKPTVYYEIYSSHSGLMAAGGGSWINEVITTAGGINILGNETQEWVTTSSEVIMYRNPSVILLPTNMGKGTPSYGSVEDVKARPGWDSIDAIKNDRIFVFDQDIFNQAGLRIADQVRAVASSLYPQLFP